MTHKNEFASSGSSPSPDFSVRDEGTILVLTPLNEPARTWIDENIGRDNGYQGLWPTVIIEPRYFRPILDAIVDAGFEVRS